MGIYIALLVLYYSLLQKENYKMQTNKSNNINQQTVIQLPSPLQSSCPHHKHTPPHPEATHQLQNRLNRMIGQLNGIKKMLDDNRYCGDILTPDSSRRKRPPKLLATSSLQDHLETCVVEEIQNGNTEILEEAIDLIKKTEIISDNNPNYNLHNATAAK